MIQFLRRFFKSRDRNSEEGRRDKFCFVSSVLQKMCPYWLWRDSRKKLLSMGLRSVTHCYFIRLILSKNGTLIATQMKSFGPKEIQIPCMDQKVPFWQFFRQGRSGWALLVRPSRIPHRISKNIFALGADEFLEMLEGKIREAPFF